MDRASVASDGTSTVASRSKFAVVCAHLIRGMQLDVGRFRRRNHHHWNQLVILRRVVLVSVQLVCCARQERRVLHLVRSCQKSLGALSSDATCAVIAAFSRALSSVSKFSGSGRSDGCVGFLPHVPHCTETALSIAPPNSYSVPCFWRISLACVRAGFRGRVTMRAPFDPHHHLRDAAPAVLIQNGSFFYPKKPGFRRTAVYTASFGEKSLKKYMHGPGGKAHVSLGECCSFVTSPQSFEAKIDPGTLEF